MTRRLRLFGLPTLASLSLTTLFLTTACVDTVTTAGQPTVRACTARLAVFGPLSGSSAHLGHNIQEGVVLRVEQYNAAHPGCPVSVADFDSQADPKQAPALAQEVVADARILGVIGPAFSGESQAADPLLDQGGVPTITPSATEASLATSGWRTFHRILGNDAEQGPAAGRYIETVLHARKVFVIDDTGAYGHGLASEVIDVLGDRVVQSAQVLPGQSDFTALAGQVRSAAPDTIFYGGYYDEAGTLLRQVRAAGVTAAFVAGDGVKDDGFLSRAGPAAEGAVITCPCRPPETVGSGFSDRYRARFGHAPGTYSAEAYDAASVFLDGIADGRMSRTAMRSYVDGFDGPGVTTLIHFTANGELASSSVAVWAYRVRAGAIVPERPIP